MSKENPVETMFRDVQRIAAAYCRAKGIVSQDRIDDITGEALLTLLLAVERHQWAAADRDQVFRRTWGSVASAARKLWNQDQSQQQHANRIAARFDSGIRRNGVRPEIGAA